VDRSGVFASQTYGGGNTVSVISPAGPGGFRFIPKTTQNKSDLASGLTYAIHFERLYRMGPASLLFKAIIVAIVLDALLLASFFFDGPTETVFQERDARVYELSPALARAHFGEIPFETWRRKPFDRRIVEEIALDAFEASGPEESARLLKFLRRQRTN